MSKNLDKREFLTVIVWLSIYVVSRNATAKISEVLSETQKIDWKKIQNNKLWTLRSIKSWDNQYTNNKSLEEWNFNVCFPKRDWCIPEIPNV